MAQRGGAGKAAHQGAGRQQHRTQDGRAGKRLAGRARPEESDDVIYGKKQRHFWPDLPIRCTIVALAAVRRRLDDDGDDSKFVKQHDG